MIRVYLTILEQHRAAWGGSTQLFEAFAGLVALSFGIGLLSDPGLAEATISYRAMHSLMPLWLWGALGVATGGALALTPRGARPYRPLLALLALYHFAIAASFTLGMSSAAGRLRINTGVTTYMLVCVFAMVAYWRGRS